MLSPRQTDVRSIVADFLKQRFPAFAGRPIDDATALLAGGAIDSLGILDLTAFLTEQFGIEVSDDDFDPDNFETFGRLIAFVERKRT